MTTIASRLQAVKTRIAGAARAAGRAPGEITLVAVSKTFPAEAVAEACAAGQYAFGENYAQEAVGKIARLAGLFERDHDSAPPRVIWHAALPNQDDEKAPGDVRPSAGVRQRDADGAFRQAVELARKSTSSVARIETPRSGARSPEGPLLRPLEWHYIGPIQSNKTRLIAEHFDWVHGIDRAKIAERLSASRPEEKPPLQVCIQVNVSGEASKSGVAPEEVFGLAQTIMRLPRLRLQGLMAIPEPTPDSGLQRSRFRMLREIRDQLSLRGVALNTLSMGMSDDLEAAIAEGSTMVRVGRAIFGERDTGAA
jgi:uncharacterized pyridoxal phosphate-containing UPF0001 family protein